MINRKARAQLAQETVEIIEAGNYQTESGTTITTADSVAACIASTTQYLPDQLEMLVEKFSATRLVEQACQLSVANETTLTTAQRFCADTVFGKAGVLNFASAKNPGGGFLGGSQAQEESLAQSSALYASLSSQFSFYEYHRRLKTSAYSNRMIYSPNCIVFRNDEGDLLEQPYEVDILTSPAPNSGAIQRNEPAIVAKIPSILIDRASKLLALAASQECQTLILGAWGCGVLRYQSKCATSFTPTKLGNVAVQTIPARLRAPVGSSV
ncbi:MAG: TIGR02452 family protein [Chloroflexota bacterium]